MSETLVRGGVITQSCFTRDSSAIVCAFSSALKVFFLAKSDRLLHKHEGTAFKRLTIKGLPHEHSTRIVALWVNPFNQHQLVSFCSRVCCVWDLVDFVLVSKREMPRKVLFAAPSKARSGVVYCVVGDKQGAEVVAMGLQSKEEESVMRVKGAVWGLAVSPQDTHLCVSAKRQLHLHDLRCGTSQVLQHTRNVTAVAFHPQGDYLAVGDVQGEIVLWNCLREGYAASSARAKTRLHWHAHGVSSLAFSNDGSLLLSTGKENALVLWRTQTLSKSFIPHLRHGSLLGVSVSSRDDKYCVRCEDNTLLVFRAAGQACEATVKGLLPRLSRLRMVADPRARHCLVVAAENFALQQYDLQRDVSSRILNVSKVAGSARKMEHFACSRSHLITLETRKLPNDSFERTLKFWHYHKSEWWKLTTIVSDPHQGRVHDLVLSEFAKFAVTSSKDGTFNVWSVRKHDHVWLHSHTGSFKGYSAQSLSLSRDGSVLAAVFWSGSAHVVTLWDTTTWSLARALEPVASKLTPKGAPKHAFHVLFLPRSSLLLMWKRDRIWAWDLLSCATVWKRKFAHDIVDVAVSPFRAQVAVATRREVHLFEPEIQDDALWSKTYESGGTPHSLAFNAASDGSTYLTVLDTFVMLHRVALGKHAEGHEDNANDQQQSQVMEELAGRLKPLLLADADAEVDDRNLTGKLWRPLATPDNAPFVDETPSHLVQPRNMVSSFFLSSLLKPPLKTEAQLQEELDESMGLQSMDEGAGDDVAWVPEPWSKPHNKMLVDAVKKLPK